jgi:hypothetical protein
MHLDEEQIQRVLHGELTPATVQEVRSHLAGCAACQSRVDDAQREEARVFGLLRELDHPLPRIADEPAPVPFRRGPLWGRLAASIVVGLVAAGAAYAAVGGKLPGIFQRVADWVAQNPAPNQPATSPPSGMDATGRGIAVTAGDRLLILFSAPRSGGLATISLADDTDVEVRTLQGQASFTSDLDRLQIDSRSDSTSFRVMIPRRAALVEVQVAGRRVFLKEGDRVVTEARSDPRGDYLIPLSW